MALKPITRQEQIIVGKNLEPITRMERFLKEYGGGSGGTQSDWNQTDSSAADFIKNKPFGDFPLEAIPETAVTGVDTDGMYSSELDATAFTGAEEKLVVVFDDVEYTCNVHTIQGVPCFGNAMFMGGENTGEPFLIVVAPGILGVMLVMGDTQPHKVSILKYDTRKIAPKYVESFRKFYINTLSNEPYIYYDVACSEKVTCQDFLDTAKKSPFQIVGTALGTEAYSSSPVCFDVFSHTGWAKVVAYMYTLESQDVPMLLTYYTAEYTPETTT